jgi:hypothetical protein
MEDAMRRLQEDAQRQKEITRERELSEQVTSSLEPDAARLRRIEELLNEHTILLQEIMRRLPERG